MNRLFLCGLICTLIKLIILNVVVEIKIPEGASKISQLDTTHHNFWLNECTINELQIINYSKVINTKTLKSRILKMFEKYNIDVTVNEVKIINK